MHLEQLGHASQRVNLLIVSADTQCWEVAPAIGKLATLKRLYALQLLPLWPSLLRPHQRVTVKGVTSSLAAGLAAPASKLLCTAATHVEAVVAAVVLAAPAPIGRSDRCGLNCTNVAGRGQCLVRGHLLVAGADVATDVRRLVVVGLQ